MQKDRAIAGALERSSIARQEARAETSLFDESTVIRPGIIIEAGDLYDVGIVGASGQITEVIEGAVSWSGAVFVANDRVYIAWIQDRPIPYILGGGGGEGGNVVVSARLFLATVAD